MVATPFFPSQRVVAALFPHIAPALRHAGWFGFFLVLAPVIGPRGYGVFMLALSGIALAEALLSETASSALDRLAVLDERHLSTALMTLIVAGAGLSSIFYATAGVVGDLVDTDGFGDMFRSLAVLPLLGALAVVPRAALRREGRQAAQVAAGIAGLAAGGGIAVSLAWAGAGPWSLVAQIVIQRLVECTVLWGLPRGSVGIAWSRPHFAALVAGVDRRAIAAALPAAARHGRCLLVGLILGPTAIGLYMLAAWLAEALADTALADGAPQFPREAIRRACRAALPAVTASLLLAIALPPILDLLWWGAVLPAQILLLGILPAGFGLVRAACDRGGITWRWQMAEALGGLVAVAFAVRYGLVAVAVAQIGWAAAVALAGLWPVWQGLGAGRRAAVAEGVRACAGAGAAGVLFFLVEGPVSRVLAPIPALVLLTATGWLLYTVIRGEPTRAAAARSSAGLTAAPTDR